MSLKNIGEITSIVNKLKDFSSIDDVLSAGLGDTLDRLGNLLKETKNSSKYVDSLPFGGEILKNANLLDDAADTIDDVGDAMVGASGGVSSLQLAFSGLVNTVKPFLPMLAKLAVGIAAVAAVAYVIHLCICSIAAKF